MLRVTHNTTLSLASSERRCNVNFWKGVALSFFLHALLFFSLRIALPPNLDHILPIPPIAVECDLGTMSPFPFSANPPAAQQDILDPPAFHVRSESPYHMGIPYRPIASLIEEEDYD
jgi:hypothetical protein